jgi:HK97 family phage major capsid protein
MTIAELKAKMAEQRAEAKMILTNAQKEKRDVTSDENIKLVDIENGLRVKALELAEAEIDERSTRLGSVGAVSDPFANISLRKMISEAASGGLRTKELIDFNERGRQAYCGTPNEGTTIYLSSENRASSMDFNVTGNTQQGGNLIQTEYTDILAPLYANLVMTKVGATYLTGLRDTITIPKYTGASAGWTDENADAVDSPGTFSTILMKPHRLTAVLTISKQLLIQNTLGVEALIRADLVRQISQVLEKSLLAVDSVANAPTSLMAGAKAVQKQLSWKELVGMETNIDQANALTGNLSYLMGPKLVGLAKTISKRGIDSTSSIPIFLVGDDMRANGYAVERTTNMPSQTISNIEYHGCAFGNFSDVIVGQWGSLEIVVDPYTLAGKNAVRLIVNSLWDACVRRTESLTGAYFASAVGVSEKGGKGGKGGIDELV